MNRQMLATIDPTFAPGGVHAATVVLPVSPAGMSCTAELWLSVDGVTKAATSGAIAFTSTGSNQSIGMSVTMPATVNSYIVYLDIKSGGILIGAYHASESVVIASAPLGLVCHLDGITQFNGSSDYILVTDSPDFSVPTTGALTICFWMKPDVLDFLNTAPGTGGGFINFFNKLTYIPHALGEWTFRIYNKTGSTVPNRISFNVFNQTLGAGVGFT
jgi:hypothetical protein